MFSPWDQNSFTLIAGIGSPYGDDQAGWDVVGVLQQESCPARVLSLAEPLQLLDHLEGCQRLLVVDACQAGHPPGAISRLEWPDPRIEEQYAHSTHGLGVGQVLRLAEQLGRLPPLVEVFGIQIARCSAGLGLCREVRDATERLAGLLLDELSEVGHA